MAQLGWYDALQRPGARGRGDVTATVQYASIAEAHARLVETGECALNEKGIVGRAGLDRTADVLAAVGDSTETLQHAVRDIARALGATPAILRS